MGRIIIEKKGYQFDAFTTSERWRNETMLNGTQQKKSVRIIAEIFACRALFVSRRPIAAPTFRLDC